MGHSIYIWLTLTAWLLAAIGAELTDIKCQQRQPWSGGLIGWSVVRTPKGCETNF